MRGCIVAKRSRQLLKSLGPQLDERSVFHALGDNHMEDSVYEGRIRAGPVTEVHAGKAHKIDAPGVGNNKRAALAAYRRENFPSHEGCCSVVLDPMTKMTSASSISSMLPVMALLPKDSIRPVTVEAWQRRAQ